MPRPVHVVSVVHVVRRRRRAAKLVKRHHEGATLPAAQRIGVLAGSAGKSP